MILQSYFQYYKPFKLYEEKRTNPENGDDILEGNTILCKHYWLDKIIPNIKQFEIKANQNQNNNRLYSAFLSTTITTAATTTSCIFVIFLFPTFIFLQETILFTRSFHYSSLKYFKLL